MKQKVMLAAFGLFISSVFVACQDAVEPLPAQADRVEASMPQQRVAETSGDLVDLSMYGDYAEIGDMHNIILDNMIDHIYSSTNRLFETPLWTFYSEMADLFAAVMIQYYPELVTGENAPYTEQSLSSAIYDEFDIHAPGIEKPEDTEFVRQNMQVLYEQMDYVQYAGPAYFTDILAPQSIAVAQNAPTEEEKDDLMSALVTAEASLYYWDANSWKWGQALSWDLYTTWSDWYIHVRSYEWTRTVKRDAEGGKVGSQVGRIFKFVPKYGKRLKVAVAVLYATCYSFEDVVKQIIEDGLTISTSTNWVYKDYLRYMYAIDPQHAFFQPYQYNPSYDLQLGKYYEDIEHLQ